MPVGAAARAGALRAGDFFRGGDFFDVVMGRQYIAPSGLAMDPAITIMFALCFEEAGK